MIALLFVSLTVPNFGGSVITVLAYVLSPSFYLLLTSKCKDTDKNLCRALSRCYCYALIVMGVSGGVIATVVAMNEVLNTEFKYPCYVE